MTLETSLNPAPARCLAERAVVANRCGITTKTVHKANRELEEAGIIRVVATPPMRKLPSGKTILVGKGNIILFLQEPANVS